MRDGSGDAGDSFVSWAAQAADVLEGAAQAAAAEGDAARAVSAAWSADLYRVQSQVWDELVSRQQLSRREYFHVLQDVSSTLDTTWSAGTAADCLDRARSSLLAGLGEILSAGAHLAMAPELADLPAPDAAAWAAQRAALLDGGSGPEVVAARRRQSADLMLRALRALRDGDDAAAIALAYESDMAALDAYLLGSAMAVGDHAFITVVSRWILVGHRMNSVPGLPVDFGSAVRAVRMVLAEALGDADGPRMLAGLQSFSA